METLLYVTSKDPDFLPASKDQSAAKQYVKRWAARNYVDNYPLRFESSDSQRYFGAFPDRLTCLECKEEFDTYEDNWAWELGQRVSISKDARNELVVMPCCGAQLKAEQLSLESDSARFSRFAIYIRDVPTVLSEKELKKLEDHLKCELIQFTEGLT